MHNVYLLYVQAFTCQPLCQGFAPYYNHQKEQAGILCLTLLISHKEPKGNQTQSGADVQSALCCAAAMMNDPEILEAGFNYVMPQNDLHSAVPAVIAV